MRIYSYPLWRPGKQNGFALSIRGGMNEVYPPPPKDSFHEETLFSCFVGKRVRDASIYVSKKYRSSFYSRALATIATNVTMLHVTCYIKNQLGHFSVSKNSIYK